MVDGIKLSRLYDFHICRQLKSYLWFKHAAFWLTPHWRFQLSALTFSLCPYACPILTRVFDLCGRSCKFWDKNMSLIFTSVLFVVLFLSLVLCRKAALDFEWAGGWIPLWFACLSIYDMQSLNANFI